MNTIGENLWGNQSVLGRDLKGPVRGSHLRNVLGFCLFAAAYYFAYRYGNGVQSCDLFSLLVSGFGFALHAAGGSAEPVVGVYPRSASDSTAGLGFGKSSAMVLAHYLCN